MRIYNGKNSQISFPFGGERMIVASHQVSTEFMPNEDFLSLIITAYDTNEVALIVSGPAEISLCSRIPGSVTYVVNTLDDAIRRFIPERVSTATPSEPVQEVPVASEPASEVSEPTSEPIQEEVKEEDQSPVIEEKPQTEEPEVQEPAPEVEKPVLKVKRSRRKNS